MRAHFCILPLGETRRLARARSRSDTRAWYACLPVSACTPPPTSPSPPTSSSSQYNYRLSKLIVIYASMFTFSLHLPRRWEGCDSNVYSSARAGVCVWVCIHVGSCVYLLREGGRVAFFRSVYFIQYFSVFPIFLVHNFAFGVMFWELPLKEIVENINICTAENLKF